MLSSTFNCTRFLINLRIRFTLPLLIQVRRFIYLVSTNTYLYTSNEPDKDPTFRSLQFRKRESKGGIVIDLI